ncbi:MAG TPA: hypothetical protein VFJ61_03170 [Solirubrobacterales bacterium]|nr:hypothetical protein [Solirubrobacterales bacterium]
MARSSALLVLLVALIAVGAAPAQAEDAFYFESSTGMKFLGEDMDGFQGGCWFGPTGNMIDGKAAEDGSIRADFGPLAECDEAWGANFSFGLGGSNYGSIDFGAYDWPFAGSQLDCLGNGAESARLEGQIPIERFMSIEVEGDTCIVEWLPGARPSALAREVLPSHNPGLPGLARGWHSRLVSSLARVSEGRAKVRVQVFGTGSRPVRDRITLRTRSGRLLGRGLGTSRTATRPRLVAVPLTPVARQLLAKKKEIVVRASLAHADGTPGSGDETKQLVLRRSGV